jgi:hypothetical protein
MQQNVTRYILMVNTKNIISLILGLHLGRKEEFERGKANEFQPNLIFIPMRIYTNPSNNL